MSAATKRTVQCDVCLGAKVTSAFVDGPSGSGFTNNMPCPECGGAGRIPEERIDFRRRGKDCRKVRLDMRRTLGDVADSMRSSLSYVSRMEQGLNNPEPLERYWFKGEVP